MRHSKCRPLDLPPAGTRWVRQPPTRVYAPCQNSDQNHISVQALHRLPLVRVSAFSRQGRRFPWEGLCLIQPPPSAPPRRKIARMDPFDEATIIDDEEPPELAEHPLPGHTPQLV